MKPENITDCVAIRHPKFLKSSNIQILIGCVLMVVAVWTTLYRTSRTENATKDPGANPSTSKQASERIKEHPKECTKSAAKTANGNSDCPCPLHATGLAVKDTSSHAASGDLQAGIMSGESLPADFLEQVVRGNRISFTLPDGTALSGEIETTQSDGDGLRVVQARVISPAMGFCYLQRQTVSGVLGPYFGHVIFDDNRVWKIEPTVDFESARFVERGISDVMCSEIAVTARYGKRNPIEDGRPNDTRPDRSDDQGEAGRMMHAPSAQNSDYPPPPPLSNLAVIRLESLPGATGVIYLDFDGEQGPFNYWGDWFMGDHATHSGISNSRIINIWKRVAEDFLPFNLNVTTDRAVFEAASPGHRQHAVIGANVPGGAAVVGSYNSSDTIICWIESDTDRETAEVIAHEVGHAMGLGHHGGMNPGGVGEYYDGHGGSWPNHLWAPIMGRSFLATMSHWSKGDYNHATNPGQDDLAIISAGNNVGYRPDDAGHTLGTARHLNIRSNGAVSSVGIIERTGDVDGFRFRTNGGLAMINVDPAPLNPNLDIQAEIVHASSLSVVVSHDHATALYSRLSANLAAGEYMVRVRGVGRGDPLTNGYSNYASLGTYYITGTVAGGIHSDHFQVVENPANGTPVGNAAPRNNHGSTSLQYAITSGNPGNTFAINASTGAITVANNDLLDFESLSSHWAAPAEMEFVVTITNSSNPSLNETIRMVVAVHDMNEPLVMEGESFTALSNIPVGTFVGQANALDPDLFDTIQYDLVGGDPDDYFLVNYKGEIRTKKALTVPSGTMFPLVIRATDQGSPSYSVTAIFPVTVRMRITPANFSFQTPVVPERGYQYTPTGASWTFSANAGIAAAYSDYIWGPVHGSQAAFLENSGTSISQSVHFTEAGTYTLQFYATGEWWDGSMPLTVKIGNNTVLSLSTAQIIKEFWNSYTTNPFTVEAGNHTISFVTGTKSGRGATIIDAVLITESSQLNSPPIAASQSVTTTANISKAITLTGTDPDGDALTYAIVTQPSNGTLSGPPPNVTYTPYAGYIGTDSFTFKVNDGTVDSPVATVNVSVSKAAPSVSAWPTASGITYGQALASSTLSGGAASVPGAFTYSSPATVPNGGTYSAAVTFTPADTTNYANVNGTVNVTVAKAATSVSIWPTASKIGQGQPLSTSILTGGSASVPGTFAFSSPGTIPGIGTYSAAVVFTPTEQVNYQTVSGTVDVNVLSIITPNNFSFETPALANNAWGAQPANASWTFGTGTGTAANGSPWFTASAPDGTRAAYLQQSGKTISQSVDFPSAGTYTITFSAIGRAGTIYGSLPLNVQVNGTTVLSLTTAQISTASWTRFTASPISLPAGNHTIAFVNGTQTGDRANCIDNIRILFEPADNSAPVANAQTVSTEAGTSKPITLTGSDVDNDPLTFAIVTQPSNGSLAGTPPDVIYTPNTGYVGADSFTFKVNDGAVDSPAATVILTVNIASPTVSTWPTASGITYGQALSASTLSGGTASVPGTFAFNSPTTEPNAGTYSAEVIFTPTDAVSYNSVLGNVNVAIAKATPVITALPTASDIEYGQYFSASSLSGGTASTTGTFAFSGAAVEFIGQDAFTFRVSDGTLVSEPATVSLSVNTPAEEPLAAAATTTRGDGYTVVTFTEDEAWTVPAGVTSVEVLVVGGGGGGGASISFGNAGGGGGGGGGLIHIPEHPVTSGNTIQVTVGAGGAPGTTGNNPGSNGQNSVFGELVALGGGGGSGGNMVGLAGGSGGGSRINSVVGGAGQQPSQPGLSGQYGYGHNGGAINEAPGSSAGGGGGAGAAGNGITGGSGRLVSITGTAAAYAGGGGGGGAQGSTPGNGGTGGGGRGANDGTAATFGTPHTGSGGGGGNNNRGGAQGGSGIVIVAYNDSNQPPVANAQSVTIQSTSPTAITLTGNDPDNDPLTFEIVTQPTHGTLSGTAPNVTYTPPPVPEPGVHPVAIVFTPADTANYNSVSSTVDVTVLGSVSPYNAWAGPSGHNLSGGPDDDDDGDGFSNFHEFAFGMDPTNANSHNPIVSGIDPSTHRFSYTRSSQSDLTYTVWTSTDLVTWNGPVDVVENAGTSDAEGVVTVEVTLTPPPDRAKLFIRVRAD